jgi:hypothetical protein
MKLAEESCDERGCERLKVRSEGSFIEVHCGTLTSVKISSL